MTAANFFFNPMGDYRDKGEGQYLFSRIFKTNIYIRKNKIHH